MSRRRRKGPSFDALLENRRKDLENKKQSEASLFNIVSLVINAKYGMCSSFSYKSQLRTRMATSHKLSNHYLPTMCNQAYPTSLDVDPINYKYFVCGRSDGGVAIYNTISDKDGKYPLISAVTGKRTKAHKSMVTCVQWFPVDAGLFTSSCSKVIRVWDPNTMKVVEMFTPQCRIYHHHMSPVASKHSILAAGADKGQIILCDLRSGSTTHRLFGHDKEVRCVQWNPENQYLLSSGSADCTVRLWDIRSSRSCLKILKGSVKNTKSNSNKLPTSHSHGVVSLCYTKNGQWLLSLGFRGKLKLWNTLTGESKKVSYEYLFSSIDLRLQMDVTSNLSSDLVYIPNRSHIMVYEIQTGKLVNILKGHFSHVLGITYNPSSMKLYSYGLDRNLAIWEPCLNSDTSINNDKPTIDAWSDSSDEDDPLN